MNKQSGMTLMELVVAMAIASIVSIAAYNLFFQGLKQSRKRTLESSEFQDILLLEAVAKKNMESFTIKSCHFGKISLLKKNGEVFILNDLLIRRSHSRFLIHVKCENHSERNQFILIEATSKLRSRTMILYSNLVKG